MSFVETLQFFYRRERNLDIPIYVISTPECRASYIQVQKMLSKGDIENLDIRKEDIDCYKCIASVLLNTGYKAEVVENGNPKFLCKK